MYSLPYSVICVDSTATSNTRSSTSTLRMIPTPSEATSRRVRLVPIGVERQAPSGVERIDHLPGLGHGFAGRRLVHTAGLETRQVIANELSSLQ